MKRRIGNIIRNIDLFIGIGIAVLISIFIVFMNFFFIFKHISYDILEKTDYFKFQNTLQFLLESIWIKLVFLILFDLFIMFFVIYFIVKILSNSHDNIVHGLKKIKDGNLNFRIENEHKKYNEIIYTINQLSEEYRKKINQLREYLTLIREEHSKCSEQKKCNEMFEKIEEELKRFNL